MEENSQIPLALHQLISELSAPPKPQYNELLFPAQTRLKPEIYGMVEALTQHAGTSRNKLMNQLIEVGIQTTLSALPEEVVAKLEQAADAAMNTAIQKNAGLFERGEA